MRRGRDASFLVFFHSEQLTREIQAIEKHIKQDKDALRIVDAFVASILQ